MDLAFYVWSIKHTSYVIVHFTYGIGKFKITHRTYLTTKSVKAFSNTQYKMTSIPPSVLAAIQETVRELTPTLAAQVYDSLSEDAINDIIQALEKANVSSTSKAATKKATAPAKATTGTASSKMKDPFEMLPQLKSDVPQWFETRIQDRIKQTTNKDGTMKDPDVLYNLGSGRFIKKATIKNAGHKIVYVTHNGVELGMTDGGKEKKLESDPHFQTFIKLMTSGDDDGFNHTLNETSELFNAEEDEMQQQILGVMKRLDPSNVGVSLAKVKAQLDFNPDELKDQLQMMEMNRMISGTAKAMRRGVV